MQMKLYHLTQDHQTGYDTYSDAVVAAPSEKEARCIHPSGERDEWCKTTWAPGPEYVQVTLIGVAEKGMKRGVIVASFHAG